MARSLRAFWADETALTTVEYAILLAVIVTVSVALWWHLGGSVRIVFRNGRKTMTEAGL